ncbi:DUF3558 domain-containing protein [Nocardia thailandica]|uniref:DUF3558 domain-containing protein n=1 Tax=Nocardia thailandica TaxID=257275 RepID=UPI0005B79572|nr:DUF3558 domain-containing protein [Nocardia thailandica]
MRVIGVVAGLCAVALAVVGCGETVSGSGQPTTSAAGAPLSREQLFDPCTLPDSVIAATGVDPSWRESHPFGVDREQFKGCQWEAKGSDGRWGHFITVGSTTHTLDDFRANSYYRNFRAVKVGDRDAIQFNLGTAEPPSECEIAFSTTSQGVIFVTASKYIDSKTSTDPCKFAAIAAEQVAPSVPR